MNDIAGAYKIEVSRICYINCSESPKINWFWEDNNSATVFLGNGFMNFFIHSIVRHIFISVLDTCWIRLPSPHPHPLSFQPISFRNHATTVSPNGPWIQYVEPLKKKKTNYACPLFFRCEWANILSKNRMAIQIQT